MTIPSLVAEFEEGLSPKAVLDFLIPCAPLLEEGEELVAFTLTPLPEAVALGLILIADDGREAVSIESNRTIWFWLEIDPAMQSDPAFEGAGVKLPIELLFTTNSAPKRTRQVTMLVPVARA